MRMSSDTLLLATSLLGVVAMTGCRTTEKVLVDYEKIYSAGRYADASVEVSELAAKGDDTQVMWRLLAASALRQAQAGEAARDNLEAAEDAMMDNDRRSVFAKGGSGALAMLTNDRCFPYDGGGQDRIFTCLYRGIDYVTSGKDTEARTEFNRAQAYQENWLDDRRRDIAAAAERLEKEANAYEKEKGTSDSNRGETVSKVLGDAAFSGQIKQNLGFDTATSGNLDTLPFGAWMNPYASHLTGVFRWLNGDDARNFLKDAASCRQDNSVAVRDFAECNQGARPNNQVWVYVEDGLCPKREEWRIDLPLFLLPYTGRYVKYAGMAFPKLVLRSSAANAWSVAGEGEVRLEELADIDALTRLEYDVYMRGALTREITRTVVKTGVQIALGVTAEQTDDWRTRVALKASQVGVATWAMTTTAADIRSWTSLPKRVFCARVDRPSDGIVRLRADGRVVAEIPVPTGNTMIFVTKPAPSATPVVKTYTVAK